MSNLGKAIRQLRKKLELSVAEISENICSVKYIYLIEIGKRYPSTGIRQLLSRRLKYDLVNLTDYENFEDPLDAHSIMGKLKGYIRTSKYDEFINCFKSLKEEYVTQWKLFLITSQMSLEVIQDINLEENIEICRGLMEKSAFTSSITHKMLDTLSAENLSVLNMYHGLTLLNGNYASTEPFKVITSYLRMHKDYCGFETLISQNYLLCGLTQYRKGNILESLQVFQEFRLFELKHSSFQNTHKIYNNIALSYLALHNSSDASKYINLSIELATLCKDDYFANRARKFLID